MAIGRATPAIPTGATNAATTIWPALLVLAIGHAGVGIQTNTLGSAIPAGRTCTAKSTASVTAALLAAADRHAVGFTLKQLAVESRRAGTATTTTPIYPALLAGTVDNAFLLTKSRLVAHETWRTVATASATAIIATLLARAIRLTYTLTTAVANKPGSTGATAPATAISSALLAGTIWSTGAQASGPTDKARGAIPATPTTAILTTLLAGTIGLAPARRVAWPFRLVNAKLSQAVSQQNGSMSQTQANTTRSLQPGEPCV